jgi:beta-lactamase regulating signal transducer with metallopeptidase domain
MGVALVAWMMLFTHLVWLAVLHVTGCGPDGDELHRLLLGLAPFTCGFAVALRVTRQYPEIHAMLRWLAVPLALLAPFCLRTIWSVFNTVNLQGTAICSAGEAPLWQQTWAPLQLLTIVAVLYLASRTWRSKT